MRCLKTELEREWEKRSAAHVYKHSDAEFYLTVVCSHLSLSLRVLFIANVTKYKIQWFNHWAFFRLPFSLSFIEKIYFLPFVDHSIRRNCILNICHSIREEGKKLKSHQICPNKSIVIRINHVVKIPSFGLYDKQKNVEHIIETTIIVNKLKIIDVWHSLLRN